VTVVRIYQRKKCGKNGKTKRAGFGAHTGARANKPKPPSKDKKQGTKGRSKAKALQRPRPSGAKPETT
jgi:hypothetical protein